MTNSPNGKMRRSSWSLNTKEN